MDLAKVVGLVQTRSQKANRFRVTEQPYLSATDQGAGMLEERDQKSCSTQVQHQILFLECGVVGLTP